ncbi:SCO family protein [Sphingomonas sp. BN140010]|uniref:SCO family protein n=1 Tax=Sphingomonas arvum TaxID=2992113 RepID=A0ABT3JCF5_9SPHN|nr:SCO family protein [Sphingomonas sp. BN140010]MCW3796762.1 SCO family protein [Sphingomonas sp. BN140010]
MPDMPTTDPRPNAALRRIRLLVWVLVALAALGFAYLWLTTQRGDRSEMAVTPQGQASSSGVQLGGPFTLTGADGKPFSSAQALAGKPYVIFFGFTHCPDVCPNTLARLAQLRQKLNAGPRPFEIVFVTVDPERDTPQAVGSYAQLFNTPIIGLTGTRQQIDQVAKQHAIYQAKVKDPASPDGYTMDHGAAALLFGRDGRFVSTIAQEEGDDVALAKLRRIVA